MDNLPIKEEQKDKRKELSAREIFNRILKGQVIRIPNDPQLAKQLFNHLNVIKSREKRIFADLGLDFISSVISVSEIKSPPQYIYDPNIPNSQVEISGSETIVAFEIRLIAPKKKKKYTAFIIQDEPNLI